MVGFPYVFKFLWAPLLDRYLPPVLGRRRGWILIYQACLAIAIGVMGFCSPIKEPYVLGVIALLVAFLSASQDIVVDAYRVDVIPPSERALAAAATTFGFRTAAMLAGTVLVLIAAGLEPRVGTSVAWRVAFLLVACVMAATMLATVWAPEPEVPGRPPTHPGGCRVAALAGAHQAKGRPGAFLLLVLLYKVGDAFALSLYSAFMIKGVGIFAGGIERVGKVNMTVSTIIGVSIGGGFYIRWGMFRSMLIFGIGQAFTNLLYMWLALVRQETVAAGACDQLGHGNRRHGPGGIRRLLGVPVQSEFQRHPVRAAVGAIRVAAGVDGLRSPDRSLPRWAGRISSS